MNENAKTDQFRAWLVHMDDALAAFLLRPPKAVQQRLDHSIESLNALEGWLLQIYPSIEHARQPSESAVLDGAARYVGEVLRVASGGKWSIQFEDPKRLFYGLPVLMGGRLGSIPACPLTMVTASLDRRNGKYLSSIVKNFAK